MADHGSSGTTGSGSGAASDDVEHVVSGAVLRDSILTHFAPGAAISFALPSLTFEGTEQLRGLVGSILPGVETAEVVVRRNANGEITAVTVPISAQDLARVQQLVSAPAAVGVTATAPAGKGGGNSGGSKFTKVISQIWNNAGPTIASIVALVGLIFLLFPRLKPDEPPVELSVDVSEVTVEEWLSPAGVVVSYRVSFLGYKGKKIQIEWAPFDAATRTRVDFGTLAEPATRDFRPGIDPQTGNAITYAIKADAKTDQARERITAYPASANCIFIRVYAYDDRTPHTRLDYDDSAPFNSLDPHADCSQFAATPTASPVA